MHALNALLLALEHRRRTGEGVFIEAAMVDAALSISAEQVIEYSAYGALLDRAGNRGPTAAPQNLYRCADIDEFGRPDSWVAIAIESEDQRTRLIDVLGSPSWATDPKLSGMAGRRAHEDLIDEQLAAWCERRSAEEIVTKLWDAGVPVAEVMQPHRQTELAQLGYRGFFEEVDHPVNGRANLSTVPMRSTGGPTAFHTSPAPILGQHNHELLTELGLSASEIADLEADGIIGSTPAMRPSS